MWVGGYLKLYQKILIELFLTSLTPCSLLRPLHAYVYSCLRKCVYVKSYLYVKTGVLDNLDYILTPKRKYLYIELGN